MPKGLGINMATNKEARFFVNIDDSLKSVIYMYLDENMYCQHPIFNGRTVINTFWSQGIIFEGRNDTPENLLSHNTYEEFFQNKPTSEVS